MTYPVAFGGERIDRIARKLMQTELQGTVEALLEANPGLASMMTAAMVPADTRIRTPVSFSPKTSAKRFILAWE